MVLIGWTRKTTGILAALALAAVPAAPCGAGERLCPEDLEYLGAFRLPVATGEAPAV